jgi:hypothetical protein
MSPLTRNAILLLILCAIWAILFFPVLRDLFRKFRKRQGLEESSASDNFRVVVNFENQDQFREICKVLLDHGYSMKDGGIEDVILDKERQTQALEPKSKRN